MNNPQQVIVMITDGTPTAYVNDNANCRYGTTGTNSIGGPFPSEYRRRRNGDADGIANAIRCADKWASSAKVAGTRIVSVGIGPGIDTGKLQDWASGPGDANVYSVEFGAIDSILDDLVEDLACNA